MPKKFAEEEKARILARVAEIGAAAAAREAGVSYNSVLKWMKGSATTIKKGVEMTGDLVESPAFPTDNGRVERREGGEMCGAAGGVG